MKWYIFLFLSFGFIFLAIHVNAQPPLVGDWVVNGQESYENEIIFLDGNLTVNTGGKLFLKNVTLIMNSSYIQYYIKIAPFGEIYIYNSTIMASLPFNNYTFEVQPSGKMELMDSEVQNCGYLSDDMTKWGMFIMSSNVKIERNYFTNNLVSIITVFSSPKIESNKITLNKLGGIVTAALSSPKI
ncbi:MAG: right-handed parallel beta-helix repeat-containing protein, partial [Candidatus Thermoplasmatota archaeon]